MTTHNLSYWELDTYFANADITIIGSGIIGLNAALNLKLKAPTLKILVLERGFLPTGASTKNAGFTCFGSPSEILDDLQHSSEEKVFGLVEKRYKGLERLRANLGDRHIDFHQWGGYEVFDQEDVYEHCMDKLDYLNKHIGALVKHAEVYRCVDEKIAEFGFQQVKHLILNVAEGQIHTGKMMLALTQRVQALGVIILNAIEVKEFMQEDQHVVIKTTKGFHFNTKKLLIAVNGFARELLPEYEVFPARSQVLVTSPIQHLKVKGTFHYDEGYYYFRNIGNRLLFGGGRNLDFTNEATSDFGLTPIIQERLESLLHDMILPGDSYKIEARWSGIMGLGNKDKTFIVKQVQDNVYCSVRMGGMGVAVGSLVGEEAANLILQSG